MGLKRKEWQIHAEWFARCNEANRDVPGWVPLSLPREEPTPVTLRVLVNLVCVKYTLTAPEVWAITMPDLLLMLREPEEPEKATNLLEAKALEVAGQERKRYYDMLTVEQRLELEDLVSRRT